MKETKRNKIYADDELEVRFMDTGSGTGCKVGQLRDNYNFLKDEIFNLRRELDLWKSAFNHLMTRASQMGGQ